MRAPFVSLLLLVAPTIAQELTLAQRGDTNCTEVHIFLARGNNEPYPGRQSKLVAAICEGLKSCDYEDIAYYNPFEAPYCESVAEGASNGISQITAYNARCPESKLVVSGYSQGAHVVGDVLGGGGGVYFQGCVQTPNDGLDFEKAPGNMIRAALLFGNTLHTANQPFNYESGSGGSGLFPRSGDRLAGLNKFASVLRDYCVASDPICADGDVVANHLNYFDIYSTNAASWVVEKLGLEDGSTSNVLSTTTRSTARSSTDISRSSSKSEASSAYASATSFSEAASQTEDTTASETYASTASETQGTTEQTTQPTSSDSQDNAPDASDGSSLVSLSSISMGLILGFVISTFAW
ncbi:unnamed protein product [Clonostachys byssicola]|uniref:Cutinase n=1 Tax=Clonostachys byssicola TaxID=160290 RepID=A0A9N9UW52_9HYPO|nr:unnamed protein product [Clonostachys byssicola]